MRFNFACSFFGSRPKRVRLGTLVCWSLSATMAIHSGSGAAVNLPLQEHPAMAILIKMGVIDRSRLEEMPSHKRRRLEDAADEVTGRKPNTGILARQTVWQVKTGEASDNQGSTWTDLKPVVAEECEKIYRYTMDWTDNFWDIVGKEGAGEEHEQDDPVAYGAKTPHHAPIVLGSEVGQPGYNIIFNAQVIYQKNIGTGTQRPVRKVEIVWGEDERVIYAAGSSSTE